MARVKPTEIKLVAELLLSEAPDADTLAKEIIERLDEKRESEAEKAPPFCIVYYEPNANILATYGPFGTEKQAERLASRLVSAGPKPAKMYRTKLYREVNDGS